MNIHGRLWQIISKGPFLRNVPSIRRDYLMKGQKILIQEAKTNGAFFGKIIPAQS